MLVAVIKAWQSTDPHLGPGDFREGWRPEQNVDPRIMISSVWAPMFAPLPGDLRRALTNALLAAWMDKNLEYPVAKYLPVQAGLHESYTPRHPPVTRTSAEEMFGRPQQSFLRRG